MSVLASVRARVWEWYEKCPGWRRWIPVAAWMAVIYVLSAQAKLPSPPSPFWHGVMEKGGHTLEYAVLSALVWFALGRRMPLLTWGLAVAYAVSDEVHQSFVPGRNPDPVDVGFDAVGAALAVLLLWWWRSSRRQSSLEGRPHDQAR